MAKVSKEKKMKLEAHGIYKASELSNAEYHALEGISKSGLDLVNRSPAHYKYPAPRVPTRFMDVGTAIHCAILEPEEFARKYMILNGIKTRTAPEYKKAAKVLGPELVLTETEGAEVTGMMEASKLNKQAQASLAIAGNAELSVIAKDPVTGIQVRCRFDWLTDCGDALDVKKTQDVRDDAFSKSVHNYRYHVQQAFYEDVYFWLTGERLKSFKFWAIEQKKPHSNRIINLDHEAVMEGRRAYRANLNLLADCIDKDVWPGIYQDEGIVSLPPWAFDFSDEEQGIY